MNDEANPAAAIRLIAEFRGYPVCTQCGSGIEGIRYELHIIWRNDEETVERFHRECLQAWLAFEPQQRGMAGR